MAYRSRNGWRNVWNNTVNQYYKTYVEPSPPTSTWSSQQLFSWGTLINDNERTQIVLKPKKKEIDPAELLDFLNG